MNTLPMLRVEAMKKHQAWIDVMDAAVDEAAKKGAFRKTVYVDAYDELEQAVLYHFRMVKKCQAKIVSKRSMEKTHIEISWAMES